jgi:hypothetical protein
LDLCPVTFDEASQFVQRHHRHHKPATGHKFSIGVTADEQLVGVAVVGRPVARSFDDGWTLEVTRACTDGTPNVNSMLYAAAWRCARSLGYRRLITYTTTSESGASLRAAGWRIVAQRTARPGWDAPSRPRVDTGTRQGVARRLWERGGDAEAHGRCTECGGGVSGRQDARYCSGRCRQRAYRRRASRNARYG